MNQELLDKLAQEGGHWSSKGLEKFAELIIQECVKVAMRSVSDDEPKESWYLIQEHFGVKNERTH